MVLPIEITPEYIDPDNKKRITKPHMSMLC